MTKNKICAVDNCDKPARTAGLCVAHYKRKWRHGDPLGGQRDRGIPLQWVRDHVSYKGDECLIWPFARMKNGYGSIGAGGKVHIVSRLMCEMVNGPPVMASHHAAHSCGNGRGGCVNPNHLRWATPTENSLDRFQHGTMPTGEQHHRAKLTDEAVSHIRAMKGRVVQRELAEQYGVTRSLISMVQSGKHWA